MKIFRDYNISGIVGGGVGMVNYSWFYEGEQISTDINLPAEDLSPGQYTLVAIDQCENMAQDIVNFDLIPLTPTVEITSDFYSDPYVMTEGCGFSTLLFQLPYAYAQDYGFLL